MSTKSPGNLVVVSPAWDGTHELYRAPSLRGGRGATWNLGVVVGAHAGWLLILGPGVGWFPSAWTWRRA